jgi:hypothetical protein
LKSIDEIVNTFINDLKKTKEYKEAWRNSDTTSGILFNFQRKRFEIEDPDYLIDFTKIVMDEEILLGH